jgi:hypothetical protein
MIHSLTHSIIRNEKPGVFPALFYICVLPSDTCHFSVQLIKQKAETFYRSRYCHLSPAHYCMTIISKPCPSEATTASSAATNATRNTDTDTNAPDDHDDDDDVNVSLTASDASPRREQVRKKKRLIVLVVVIITVVVLFHSGLF